MENRECVIDERGATIIEPVGQHLTDAEVDQISDALDGLDFQGIVRGWLDDIQAYDGLRVRHVAI